MSHSSYAGKELETFALAANWKHYINSLIKQYIKGDVLEVGAGIGRNTCLLCCPSHRNWLCLEPDIKLFQTLKESVYSYKIDNCYCQNGTIDSLNEEQLFDSILYLDVLEHIREDRDEIIRASQHLQVGGYLIVLAPAHQWLFSPFDEAIGHYCRYSQTTLSETLLDSIEIVKLVYLDCVGLLAVLGNKLILKQSQPTMQQIELWDKFMVPVSRILDKFLAYKLGKSILLIGKKIKI